MGMNRLNCIYLVLKCWMKARGLQSVRKSSARNIFKHLGIAHKILRYKVKTRKRKISKKISKRRKTDWLLQLRKKDPKEKKKNQKSKKNIKTVLKTKIKTIK